VERGTLAVRLFARFRDVIGSETLAVPIAEGERIRDLRRRIGEQFPNLQVLLQRSAFAINGEFAEDDNAVSSSDEVALIPPVSGGSLPPHR
jgi:molybdopterin converting factor small subunit